MIHSFLSPSFSPEEIFLQIPSLLSKGDSRKSETSSFLFPPPISECFEKSSPSQLPPPLSSFLSFLCKRCTFPSPTNRLYSISKIRRGWASFLPSFLLRSGSLSPLPPPMTFANRVFFSEGGSTLMAIFSPSPLLPPRALWGASPFSDGYGV